jgi:hypothetical protein
MTVLTLITMSEDDFVISLLKNDFKVRCMEVNDRLLGPGDIIPLHNFEVRSQRGSAGLKDANKPSFDMFAQKFQDFKPENGGKPMEMGMDMFDDAFGGGVEKKVPYTDGKELTTTNMPIDPENQIFKQLRGEKHPFHHIMLSIKDGLIANRRKPHTVLEYFEGYDMRNDMIDRAPFSIGLSNICFNIREDEKMALLNFMYQPGTGKLSVKKLNNVYAYCVNLEGYQKFLEDQKNINNPKFAGIKKLMIDITAYAADKKINLKKEFLKDDFIRKGSVKVDIFERKLEEWSIKLRADDWKNINARY